MKKNINPFQFKHDLLRKLTNFIFKSNRSSIDKSKKVENLKLSLKEAEYISNIPELKYTNQYKYEVAIVDDRPCLRIIDFIDSSIIGNIVIDLMPTYNKKGDGYTQKYIENIVEKLNAFDSMSFIISEHNRSFKNPFKF